jgi:hypothetical protein
VAITNIETASADSSGKSLPFEDPELVASVGAAAPGVAAPTVGSAYPGIPGMPRPAPDDGGGRAVGVAPSAPEVGDRVGLTEGVGVGVDAAAIWMVPCIAKYPWSMQ